jgi:hypothetical protein
MLGTQVALGTEVYKEGLSRVSHGLPWCTASIVENLPESVGPERGGNGRVCRVGVPGGKTTGCCVSAGAGRREGEVTAGRGSLAQLMGNETAVCYSAAARRSNTRSTSSLIECSSLAFDKAPRVNARKRASSSQWKYRPGWPDRDAARGATCHFLPPERNSRSVFVSVMAAGPDRARGARGVVH